MTTSIPVCTDVEPDEFQVLEGSCPSVTRSAARMNDDRAHQINTNFIIPDRNARRIRRRAIRLKNSANYINEKKTRGFWRAPNQLTTQHSN